MIWQNHPARKYILQTITTIIIIIITGVASAIFMQSLYFGIFAALILFLGLGSYFLPTWYSVNQNGVVKKIAGQKWAKSWSFFRRIAVFDDGVLLSPLERASVLDKFRGWFLPTSDEKTIDYIRMKMKK